ncbi:dabb-domain-containing protein [Hypoxylon sp. FL1284]|nr:dabb-domain-containing protein [Hypoxylon sp. FL1284]
MTIYHIVLFNFKDGIPPDEDKATCTRMQALETKCIHPTSQKTYVKVRGGKEDSAAGLQNGYTHAFFVEIENNEDRKYFLTEDPAHQEFLASIVGVVDKVQILDFTHGVL